MDLVNREYRRCHGSHNSHNKYADPGCAQVIDVDAGRMGAPFCDTCDAWTAAPSRRHFFEAVKLN
jgi:hypothetical protein